MIKKFEKFEITSRNSILKDDIYVNYINGDELFLNYSHNFTIKDIECRFNNVSGIYSIKDRHFIYIQRGNNWYKKKID